MGIGAIASSSAFKGGFAPGGATASDVCTRASTHVTCCISAKGPATSKCFPWRPAGSARLALGFGGLLLALSSAFWRSRADEAALTADPGAFSVSIESGRRLGILVRCVFFTGVHFAGKRLGVGILPAPARNFLVSGPAGGVSDGSGCAAGMASLSARMSGSGSRSDFAASFGTSANSVLLVCAASTAGDGRSRNDLDRDRRTEAHQTKEGDPHRPGHFRSQMPSQSQACAIRCPAGADGNRSSRLNSGGSVAKQP